MALGVFVTLLFLSGYYILNELTGSGIDEAVLYHLNVGVEGAGFGEFADLIVVFGIMICAAVLTAIFCFHYSRTETVTPVARARFGLATIALLISNYLNPGAHDVAYLLAAEPPQSTATKVGIPDRIVTVEQLRFEGDKKNLVLLYLESIEQTYFDQTLFPDLMPGLTALQDQALRFVDITQTYGTSWTIAGMVASQCGIPLVGSGGDGADQFLPDATCLGDLLQDAGYNLDYIGGAPSAFAGKGTFYTSHGFRSVDGYLDLRARSAVPEYRHYWGMYDDTVFSEVTARFESYTQEYEPFGLVALTLDSHDRTGRTISDSCEGYVYQDGRNASLNSVHCTDKLATEFIQRFLDSQAFEDTVLIVMSDHFARPNLASDTLETAQRRNLLWAFGADIPAAVVSTPGTTIDAAPTVLRMLGGEISALGYGRDLQAQSSLLRQADVDPEALFREDSNYLNALWSYPNLRNGVTIDLAEKKLLLGERFITFPSLLHIDQDLNVTKFDFEVPGEKTLASYVVDLNHDERVLWVDECERASVVLLTAAAPVERYCVVIGSLGSDRTQLLSLSDDEHIDASLISAIFQNAEPNWAYYDRRIGEMQRAVSFSDSAVVRYSPTNGMVGQIAVRSSSRANSGSWVLDRNLDVRVGLERGVNLIGFNDGQDPVRIGHRDTCGAGQEITSSVAPRLENIQETIARNIALYGAFAIVVHNSAVCFEVDPKLDVLFEGTNLIQWKDAYFNQPYIAVISGNGETQEFLGEANTALGVELTNFISMRRQRQLAWLPRVGHAGGVYQGKTYTNSIDALSANQDLYEIIEIDLSWTSDDDLVCLHDWASGYIDGPKAPLSLAEFQDVNAAKPEFELCTLDTLADWLRRNSGPRILIDAKAHAVDVAQMLLDRYPDLRDRFIPQIYQPDDYSTVRAMGYPDIVWTLYKYSGSDEEVLKWITNMDLLALAMYAERASTGLPAEAKKKTGVLTWVHTVNSSEELRAALEFGASEVMTDSLQPQRSMRFEAVSAGYGAGRSTLYNFETGQRLPLDRGVNLVGLKGVGQTDLLARYDGCQVLTTGEAPDPTPFREAFENLRADYDAVVFMVGDSAFCADVSLAPLLEGLGLQKWYEIGFRTPYIGMIQADGWTLEFLGPSEGIVTQVLPVIGSD